MSLWSNAKNVVTTNQVPKVIDNINHNVIHYFLPLWAIFVATKLTELANCGIPESKIRCIVIAA